MRWEPSCFSCWEVEEEWKEKGEKEREGEEGRKENMREAGPGKGSI
jgi:hypothetical protein